MAALPPCVQPLAGVPQAVDWLRAHGVGRLQSDHRRIQPGDAFVAWPGAATDGRRYVPLALEQGASVCLVEADGLDPSSWAQGVPADGPVRVGAVPGLKALSGDIAAAIYGHPSERVRVVAITGTNGKTSTAWWLAQALSQAGQSCGVMGTLGVGLPGVGSDALAGMAPTGLTTPDPLTLQAGLASWADQGVRACAIEASSIGLAEHRLQGTSLAVAVFTNFTQDHLDYHGSMADYWAAKRRLFDWKPLGAAVVNIDDPHGLTLALDLDRAGECPLWTVSVQPGSDARLCARDVTTTAQGMSMVVCEGSDRLPLAVSMVGTYNVSNVLCVLGALRALGLPLAQAVQVCSALPPVPGRMAPVNALLPADGAGGVPQPLVLVDYAHTPDALEKALVALQPLVHRRGGHLHCVVGCGGDRDATKRPHMAATAQRHATALCLTSDNPRSESPQTILDQMVAGLSQPDQARVVVDRAQAIASQIASALAADVVLIAGKGHETTQDIGGVKHPFSDTEHALRALMTWLARSRRVASGPASAASPSAHTPSSEPSA